MSASASTWTPTLPGLDDAAFERMRGDAGHAAQWRADGWERYRRLAAPDARAEEWLRTPLRRFPFAQRRLAPPMPWREGRVEHSLANDFALVIEVGPEAITLDRRDPKISREQLDVLPLIQALDGKPDLSSKVWMVRPEVIPVDPIDAALDAFWNAGIWIQLSDSVKIEHGILVLYRPAPGTLLMPRLLVHAGNDSSLGIAELAETSGGPAIVLASRQMRAERGAQVASTLVQRMDSESHWMSRDHAWAGLNAQFHGLHVHLGGRVVKTRTGGDAAGEGAHLAFSGYALGTGKRHIDQHTAQVHRHADTTSHLLFKCVVKDSARSIYQGLIAATRGAVRIDAYQKNNNLVLSDGAQADSLPGLLIDADDLKCSHGATIGSLDDEQLFYLQSRGVPETSARRLLTEAFGEQIISRIPHTGLQKWVREQASDELNF